MRSSRIASLEQVAERLGSVSARHHAEASATNGASPRNNSNASTRRLLLVCRQALNLRERVAIGAIGIAKPLRQLSQPRRPLVCGERWLLWCWNRGRGGILHALQRPTCRPFKYRYRDSNLSCRCFCTGAAASFSTRPTGGIAERNDDLRTAGIVAGQPKQRRGGRRNGLHRAAECGHPRWCSPPALKAFEPPAASAAGGSVREVGRVLGQSLAPITLKSWLTKTW